MRLLITISRLSNFLFFIQETVGHNLVKKDIDLCFYGRNKNEIWKQIKQSMGEKGAMQLQKDIISFEPIFNEQWREESAHLLLWKKYFQNSQLLFQQIFSDIKKLNGVKHFSISTIPIYLISDPVHSDKEIHAWFSWSPQKQFIVVEIPANLAVPNNFFPLSILAHEFFHLILRRNKNLSSKISETAEEYKGLFPKLLEKIPSRMFLEELLVSSFVPEGYLGEKYFHTKTVVPVKKSGSLFMWRKFVAHKLNLMAKKYTNNARQIDESYLKDLIEVIRQEEKIKNTPSK